ncbi:MAG: hypothetical protein PHE70_01170 [Tepidanaerobacteraceae bacterium]|nr:hypothetical protein [Tepidanaerobacteraceae bacterium]
MVPKAITMPMLDTIFPNPVVKASSIATVCIREIKLKIKDDSINEKNG